MNNVNIKCAFCNKDVRKKQKHIGFKIKKGQRNFYCDLECSSKAKVLKKVVKQCVFCKKDFDTSSGKDSKRCCSKTCMGKYVASFAQKKNISYASKKAWQNIDRKKRDIQIRKAKTCNVCYSIFYGKNRYCSLTCLKNSSRGEQISMKRKEMFKSGRLRVTGGTTKWIIYKNIKVQGSYEYRACLILDKLLELKLIHKWEYTNDRIQYIGKDNKQHSYLLDFKVWTDSDNFYYLETKGYKTPTDELKWNATKKLGHTLLVWYENDLKTKEQEF